MIQPNQICQMSRRAMIRSLTGSLLVGRALLPLQSKPYYPQGISWEARPPIELGFETTALDEAVRYAATHNSTGLVIVRGGRMAAEQYWQQWTPETARPIFSASKSVTATLVGMAIDDGLFRGVEQSASAFVPAWRGTPKESITIHHMLSMTTGIRVGNLRDGQFVDAFAETAALPLDHKPGEHWAYNTAVYRMLLRMLENATGETINRYTQRKFAPLQLRHSLWDCGLAPDNKTNCTWFRSTLREMAKFGLLILRNGRWEDRHLVSAPFVRESTSPSQKLNQAYGYLWWLNGKPSFRLPDGRAAQGMLWPDCPPDAFGALGAQDKKIYVVPSLDLVVARHGGPAGVELRPGDEPGGRSSFDNELLGRICRAVKR